MLVLMLISMLVVLLSSMLVVMLSIMLVVLFSIMLVMVLYGSFFLVFMMVFLSMFRNMLMMVFGSVFCVVVFMMFSSGFIFVLVLMFFTTESLVFVKMLNIFLMRFFLVSNTSFVDRCFKQSIFSIFVMTMVMFFFVMMMVMFFFVMFNVVWLLLMVNTHVCWASFHRFCKVCILNELCLFFFDHFVLFSNFLAGFLLQVHSDLVIDERKYHTIVKWNQIRWLVFIVLFSTLHENKSSVS